MYQFQDLAILFGVNMPPQANMHTYTLQSQQLAIEKINDNK